MSRARRTPPEATAAEPPEKEATSPDRHRRRGSWLWVLAGAGLVLVGAGAVVLAGSFDRPAKLRLVGQDSPVNESARSLRSIDAHNSPTLLRNPRRPSNLVVSSRIDTPFFSCALHYSLDGGASWVQNKGIPLPKGEEPKCFAPDVAFSADGTLYLSFVTLQGNGNVPNAAWLSTSKDGGRTLSKPVRVAGPLAFQVRLAADPTRPRRVYMTWLQGSDVGTLKFTTLTNPIQAARSDDGGATWTRPMRVSSGSRKRVVTPSPTVGPKGELYVLYLDLREDRLDYEGGHGGRGGPAYPGRFSLVVTRSTDGGVKWAESVVDDEIVPIGRFVVFFPPFPSVAVDKSGRIYAAFHDRRLGDPDVWLWSLKPGRNSWEGPTRINDNTKRDGTSQYLPKLGLAPNGRLDVLYYDRRADRIAPGANSTSPGRAGGRARPRNVLNDVSLQSSLDGGKTFSRSATFTSRSFDSRIGFGAKEGLPDLGSRLGLVSDNRFALGLWTDTRAGTFATQKQDLAQALATVDDPPRLSDTTENALRYGGFLLVLAGFALAALTLAGRWPPRPRSAEGADRPGEETDGSKDSESPAAVRDGS